MYFKREGTISILNGGSLKLVNKFTYLGSNVSSTECDIDMRQPKVQTAIDWLSIIWKSDLSNKIKWDFFPAAVVLIRLYGYTTWTLRKRTEKKRLDGNCTRMLWVILDKSWKQHPTKQQLYGHLPPTSKDIQVRQTRHLGHCWRSKYELISNFLLWTPPHGRASVGRPARTYQQQLCADTECSSENLPETMNDKEREVGESISAARFGDVDADDNINHIREVLNAKTDVFFA